MSSHEFSIHALLAESDLAQGAIAGYQVSFLSTLSLRRATKLPKQIGKEKRIFYPRSPCGERPGKVKVVEPGLAFLSTLSLRRATRELQYV